MDSDTVTREMLKQLVEKAKSEGANRIKRIVIEIGEMSGLNSGQIRNSFDMLSRDTLAEGAELAISEIPLQVKCMKCSAEYNASGMSMICPECGSIASELVKGNELRVKEIEVA